MKSVGKEFECAKQLDLLPQVKPWTRNLAQRPDTSFWLQISTGRCYPDFVAQLHDGRTLVIECKGELEKAEDAQEKKNLGQLCADKSAGRGLFLLVRIKATRVEGPKNSSLPQHVRAEVELSHRAA
ncbi:hypothetical protein [Variovorax paradoxus]|uniref:hypothetical protein n=1 Tax=Variovorax paradoxus TaxID=34073 RepID=UPI003991A72E